jgi:hypothetical protein
MLSSPEQGARGILEFVSIHITLLDIGTSSLKIELNRYNLQLYDGVLFNEDANTQNAESWFAFVSNFCSFVFLKGEYASSRYPNSSDRRKRRTGRKLVAWYCSGGLEKVTLDRAGRDGGERWRDQSNWEEMPMKIFAKDSVCGPTGWGER